MNKKKIALVLLNDFPLLLLATNYALYNALGLEVYKNPVRLVAMLLIVIGWIVYGNKNITLVKLIWIVASLLSIVINGTESLNFIAAVAVSICTIRDIKKNIRVMFRVNFILVISIIVLIFLGVAQNTKYVSTLGRVRWTLGFNNPNVAALFYTSCILLYVISRESIRFLHLLIAMIAEVTVYYFTNSRASMVSVIVFIVGLAILDLNYKKGQSAFWIRKSILIIIDVFFGFHLLPAKVLTVFLPFDKFTSFRVSNMILLSEQAGMHSYLFGGYSGKHVDNFYYMFLYTYGILVYLLFAISTHIALHKVKSQKNLIIMPYLLGLFVVGFFESSIMRPEIMSMLLVWIIVLDFSDKYEDSEGLQAIS